MLYWVFTISERDDKTEVLVKKFGRNKYRTKKWVREKQDQLINDDKMYPHGLFIKEVERGTKYTWPEPIK
jgi:hypothetical protein